MKATLDIGLETLDLLSSFILPPSSFHCGVAKLVRRWIVNPVIVGSSPTATAKSLPISDCQLPVFIWPTSNRQLAIGNRQCFWSGARVTEQRPFKP